MSDITPPDRQLTEPERQAFQRLGLTPGHWAALGPAPLFHHQGTRFPNRYTAGDREAADRLRQALRAPPDLRNEAHSFWDRLNESGRRPEAALAARLLAWHLATDVPFVLRVGFFQQLRQAAAHFAVPAPFGPRPPDPVHLFRALVDGYLPCPAFDPAGDPPRVPVEPPPPAALDALADAVRFPLPTVWPSLGAGNVARALPWLVHVMGEPVSDWWASRDPGRVAVERGLAGAPFDERQRLFDAIFAEWTRALETSVPWPVAKEQAQRLTIRMEEWTDAARLAARALAKPQAADPAPDDPPLAVPRTIEAEFVPLPPTAPEPAPNPVVPAVPPVPAKPKPARASATVAEPFTTVPFAAALQRAGVTTVADAVAWVDSSPRLLFDDARDEASRAVAVVRDERAVPSELWIVGDLHADVLALANIIAFAESRTAPDRPPHYLFLGDFVDRGVHDHELLLLLFGLLKQHPERVCVVPGNHDVDLQYDEAAGRFKVTIEPAEYCAELNAALARGAPEDRERITLARAFIRFCADRPRAVFLPDGTLVAHGGFPHTDAQKELTNLASLCAPRCLDDFLWARIAETARVKRPNRGSRGHEFGYDTLAQFARVAAEKLQLPVQRFVRGHDHVPDRWQDYPEYADSGVPVLTLNAMGRALDGDPPRRDGKRHPFPAVGRYVAHQLPEVVLLPLDPNEVDFAFAPPEEGGT